MEDKLVSPDYFDLVRHCAAMLGDGKVASRDKILLECMCHLTNHVDLLTYMQGIGTLKPSLLTLIEAENSEIFIQCLSHPSTHHVRRRRQKVEECS